MDDSKTTHGNEIEEALHLLGEIDGRYRHQLKFVIDAEVVALLEAMKMFHDNSLKRLKSRVRDAV